MLWSGIYMEEMMAERLSGMAEAERQLRVAQRLYKEGKPKIPWDRVGLAARRTFIDKACQPPHSEEKE